MIKDVISPYVWENYSVKIEDDIYIVPLNEDGKLDMQNHWDIFFSMIHQMTQELVIKKIQDGMKKIQNEYIVTYKKTQNENNNNINTLKWNL